MFFLNMFCRFGGPSPPNGPISTAVILTLHHGPIRVLRTLMCIEKSAILESMFLLWLIEFVSFFWNSNQHIYEQLHKCVNIIRYLWNLTSIFGFKIEFWRIWAEFCDLLMFFWLWLILLNLMKQVRFPCAVLLAGAFLFQKTRLAIEKV